MRLNLGRCNGDVSTWKVTWESEGGRGAVEDEFEVFNLLCSIDSEAMKRCRENSHRNTFKSKTNCFYV